MTALTISSVTPLSASGLRRITSREKPSVPHGTKDSSPRDVAGRAGLVPPGREQRLDHQALGVGGVAEPPERHREAALALGVAPGVRPLDQRRQLRARQVAVAPDPHGVAQPLEALDRLADRTHVLVGQVEVARRAAPPRRRSG